MGSAMAAAAAHTIYTHLSDLKRDPSYYDLILTGDLGGVGKKIAVCDAGSGRCAEYAH